MTELHPHRCDRCERIVYAEDESIWPYITPKGDDVEICGLCKEALDAAYQGKDVEPYLVGVVEHEKEFRKQVAEANP